MSDEEKEAVGKLETLIQYLSVWNENFTIVPADMKYLVPIFNLITKQSKEIEELNKENTRQHELIGNIHQKWKDKIKAKIEWLTTNILENDYASDNDQDVAEYQVIILQSLLEKE